MAVLLVESFPLFESGGMVFLHEKKDSTLDMMMQTHIN